MDDLKVFASKDEKLAEQLKLVKQYDVKMEFGLDKCFRCTFIQGKSTKAGNIKIDLDTTI